MNRRASCNIDKRTPLAHRPLSAFQVDHTLIRVLLFQRVVSVLVLPQERESFQRVEIRGYPRKAGPSSFCVMG